MVYNPQQHHRYSIRLPGYDYTSAGMYHVTIRTSDYKHLFCRIQHGQVILNEIGYIVQDIWISLPQHHAYVRLDAFVIMPNHIHAIIMLTNDTNINHGDGNTSVSYTHLDVYKRQELLSALPSAIDDQDTLDWTHSTHG